MKPLSWGFGSNPHTHLFFFIWSILSIQCERKKILKNGLAFYFIWSAYAKQRLEHTFVGNCRFQNYTYSVPLLTFKLKLPNIQRWCWQLRCIFFLLNLPHYIFFDCSATLYELTITEHALLWIPLKQEDNTFTVVTHNFLFHVKFMRKYFRVEMRPMLDATFGVWSAMESVLIMQSIMLMALTVCMTKIEINAIIIVCFKNCNYLFQ